MDKEELLRLVADAGGDILNQDESDDSSGYVDIAIWQLIALKDAILERAAVECENRVESVSMHATARDCANFNAGLHSGAASIRALKKENSV